MAVVAGSAGLGRTRRFLTRLLASLPSPWTVLIGSVLLGALMGLSTLTGLYVRDGFYIFSRDAVVLLYVYGAAAGFGPGVTLANFFCGEMGRAGRFALGGIILFLSLHTATAVLFALQYRVFYSHWHADFPSLVWAFQFTFTSAAAVYQFTVDSLYVYYPLAPVIFIGLGMWYASRAPARQH